ncbi:hypothetical protein M8C21_001552, partial [Ambrosia artemisiifolia]
QVVTRVLWQFDSGVGDRWWWYPRVLIWGFLVMMKVVGDGDVVGGGGSARVPTRSD